MAPTQSPLDIEYLLGELSSEEKIALLSGDDFWHTVAIPRLDIPHVRFSDGPNGVRGTAWTDGAPASCFPCGTGMGASFDRDLLYRIGEALGDECRARGVHCLLGPTTNIQRHPLGGRGFETYSEDPHLTGHLAVAWINGVQSRKVMATPKHFVGNEQEFMRRANNSVIDERTLHEIYLEPFRIQCSTDVKAFMTSYNRVNGTHVSESPWLLGKILRGDFEFDGLIMSDWSGTYSSSEAVRAGLDIEMPGPALMRGPCIERDIVSGKLTQGDVDKCVANILGFVNEAIESGIPFDAKERSVDTPEVRSLLRECAGAAVVLLKNDNNVLPLHPKPGMKIAVIGPNAKTAVMSGGGSANLPPTYSVTPFDAMSATAAAAAAGAEVSYARGAAADRWLPLLSPHLFLEDGAPGVRCHFFDKNPWLGEPVEPLLVKYNNSAFNYFIDGIPKDVPVRGYVSLRTRFVPGTSGKWELGLGVSGQADMYIDGEKVIDNSTDQTPSVLFFNMGAEEVTAVLDVTAGKSYDLEVRFSNFKQLHSTSPYSGRRGGIRIGGRPLTDPEAEIDAAVALARDSDVAILCIGTNCEWESEAYDRDTLGLPGHTDSLVSAVLAANPRTVVVNQSGMPVQFPWADEASTIVQAFLGGNEAGQGIADVLFGKINPSGKLPTTWPAKVEDYPSHNTFGHPTDTVYSEGVFVGYRHFDTPRGPRSAFPFGFGMSYTTFSLSDLFVTPTSDGFGADVSFLITNTGSVPGAEVAQVYVHECAPAVERPEHELAGFEKVFLAPKESKRVELKLHHTAFSYYSVVQKCWVARAGQFDIRLGSSSTLIQCTRPFYLPKSYTWVGLQEPVEAHVY